jgi:muramoyltetrapeptide carboxypeptidase
LNFPPNDIQLPQWPPVVLPGDRVGVAALSGPVDGGRLDHGLDALRALGFEPVEAANLRRRHGLFAGSDEERVEAFHALAADASIRAIFFARGGWGVPRILPLIDWSLLAETPRAYVGYSDLTPLLGQIVDRLGWIAFHGPMVAADLARGLLPEEQRSLLAALAGMRQELPLAGHAWPDAAPAVPIRGRLAGGNLSMLASLVGTPWALRLEQRLLVIEDVNEVPFRLDRMLTQLGQTGILPVIQGMILGHMTALGGPQPLSADGTVGALDVFREQAARHALPLAWGLPAGHDRPNWTLPLGAVATLEPHPGRLVIDPADLLA